MAENETHMATRLRSAREAAGLTQGQSARLLGLHRPAISEIEAGRRKVTAEELWQLADIYGVSASWLTGEGETDQGPRESRITLAARELASLKDEDLEKILNVIRTLRQT